MQHAGRRTGARVGRGELAVLEEGARIRESEEGRGRGGEEDYGVGSAAVGSLLVECDLGAADEGSLGFPRQEGEGEFPNVGEVLQCRGRQYAVEV